MVLLLAVLALTPADSLLQGIQGQVDRNEARLKKEVYSFVTTTLSRELDPQGGLKGCDTIVTWKLMRGDETLADSVIYASRQVSGNKKRMSRKMPRLTDTSYVYEMKDSQVVSFRPRRMGKGDLSYRLGFDPSTLRPRWLEIEMPKPKLPVKEFRMRIEWIVWEDMLVPGRMWLRASWKMLAISKRMEVETIYSEYLLRR